MRREASLISMRRPPPRSAIRRASSAGGSTAEASPASATPRGMPQIAALCRSWASIAPPRSTSAAAADQAVAAHAAQHHADAVLAVGLGDRGEHRIDRRQAAGRRALAVEPDPRPRRRRARRRDGRRRGDVDASSATQRIAVLGDPGGAARGAFELAGEIGHEQRRQMLGDQDRRADPRGQRAQEFEQGVKAAGRGAERDAAERARPAWRAAGAGRRARASAAEPASRSARPIRRSRSASTSAKRPAKLPMPGLGRVSAAPSGERAHRRSRRRPRPSRRRSGRARRWPAREDLGQRLEAAGAGHLDVEQDDVDADRLQRVERLAGVAGEWRRSRNPSCAGDHARQHRPRDRRIVDDHQADAAARPACSGRRRASDGRSAHATPTICSLRWSVSRSNGFITYSSAPASIAARMWAMSFSVVQNTTLGWAAMLASGEARAGTPCRSSPACSSRAG